MIATLERLDRAYLDNSFTREFTFHRTHTSLDMSQPGTDQLDDLLMYSGLNPSRHMRSDAGLCYEAGAMAHPVSSESHCKVPGCDAGRASCCPVQPGHTETAKSGRASNQPGVHLQREIPSIIDIHSHLLSNYTH